MIFRLNIHEFLHAMYKYLLNSVVKISLMFAQYLEYYAIILRRAVFRGHTSRIWSNAQRDSRPTEHRWRPLFNAAKFG